MNEAKKNKPKRRFKEFENADPWEQRKLGELAQIKDSARVPNALWRREGVPYLRSSNLDSTTNEFLYISENDYETYKSKTGAPELGDVLFNSGGNIGTAILKSDKKPVYVQGGAVLYVKTSVSKNIDGLYLKYYFETPIIKNYIAESCVGGTIKHFTLVPANSMPIAYPKKVEQNIIGSLFKKIDNLITLHQRKLEKIKSLKEAYLCEMFPAEGESKPKRRFKGFTDPWEQRKIEGYASFQKGFGLSWNDITSDGKQECILYGNLYTEYGMITKEVVYKTNKELKNGVYSKFGDVLIPASDTTPTGLARATSIEKSGVLLGGDINVIRPNDNVNGSCMSLSLNAKRQELIKLIKGTTVKHIYNSDIRNIYISLPKSNDEQVRIVSLFKDLDNIITLHQHKLDKLNNLKKAYLNEMFI